MRVLSMSEVKHYTIITTRGLEKIQSKYQAGETVNLTHMGFGGTNEYTAPNADATVVPNQWAKIPLERHPKTGFIGGGATVSNQQEYGGQWLANVGIYDEDDELIIIAATPLIEMSQDESVVASYPMNIFTVISNAASVVVITDTAITHPTHDELKAAIESVEKKIPLAASDIEVTTGTVDAKWVSPLTLKPQLVAIKQSISDQGDELAQSATTERKGLVELATQAEVDASTDNGRAVTPATLNKKSLIKQLQDFATQAANKVKTDIYGGVPASTLDTIKEVADALIASGNAISALYETIATKLSTDAFNTYKSAIKIQIDDLTKKTTENEVAIAKSLSVVLLQSGYGGPSPTPDYEIFYNGQDSVMTAIDCGLYFQVTFSFRYGGQEGGLGRIRNPIYRPINRVNARGVDGAGTFSHVTVMPDGAISGVVARGETATATITWKTVRKQS